MFFQLETTNLIGWNARYTGDNIITDTTQKSQFWIFPPYFYPLKKNDGMQKLLLALSIHQEVRDHVHDQLPAAKELAKRFQSAKTELKREILEEYEYWQM